MIKRLKKNLFSLALGEIGTKVLGALMYFVLARYLGPKGFGVYSVAVSFAVIFGLVSGLGIDSYIVKELARNPSRIDEIFSNAMFLKLIGGLLAFAASVGICMLLGYDIQTKSAIIIFSITLLFSAVTNLYDSIFRGFQQMEFSAMIMMGRSLITICIILVMILFNSSLDMIVSAHVITGFLLMTGFYFFIRNKYCRFNFSISRTVLKELIIGGFPFIATGVVFIINAKADVLLLSKLADIESVGIYDAANELILVLFIIPSLLSQVLYPHMSQQFLNSRKGLADVINMSLRVIIFISVPISLGVMILAPKIIHLFYGAKYANSSIVLLIMGAGISIVFLRSLLGWVLAAVEKVTWMMWINVYNLVLNVVFNVALIPKFGYKGAAVATISSMVLGTLTVLRVIKKEVPELTSVTLLYVKPVIACIPMVAFLLLLPNLNVFVQTSAGAVIYFTAFAVLKGFTPGEWRMLIGLTGIKRIAGN